MAEVILSGDLLFPHGTEKAIIGIRNGIIDHVDMGEVSRERPGTVRGLIVPGLIDMHTHLGDSGARGNLPFRLEEVVLPGGIKHRFLENATEFHKISSIESSLRELSFGVSHVLDFREGGIKGVKLLNRSIKKEMPQIHSMGRPVPGDDMGEFLDICSGVGMPSLEPGLEDIRQMCRDVKKPFAIHVSELYREDISRLLDLEPDLVIHMIKGTEEDWGELSSANIPVVVCPRANSAYSLNVPLHEMESTGLSIGLGTDNAISVKQDMFREMEAAWILMRKGGMEGQKASEKVFSMAVGMAMKENGLISGLMDSTMWWEKGWPRVGERADLFVLDDTLKNEGLCPFSRIVRFSGQKDVVWTGPSD